MTLIHMNLSFTDLSNCYYRTGIITGWGKVDNDEASSHRNHDSYGVFTK